MTACAPWPRVPAGGRPWSVPTYDLGGPLAGVRVPDGSNLLFVGAPLTGKRRLAYELLNAEMIAVV